MKNYSIIILILLTIINIQTIYSHPSGFKFGEIVWQIVIPDNPGTTVQDKQIKSLKQIPDVNGDNINDVVVATGNYWTICYSGLNGALIWQFSTHFGSINTGSVEWEDALDISDVNNDGTLDVVIGCGGGNEMVYALNGINGSRISSYGDSIGTSDGDIEAVNIRYDFNGDARNDVLVSASGTSTGGRHAMFCLNAVNGQVIFYNTLPQPYTDDIIGTESGGAIGVNDNGAPYLVTGFDTSGTTAWNYTSAGTIWSLKEMSDVNNDGGKDILGLGGFTGSIFAITGNTGTQIWARNLGSSNNGKIAFLDDADGNGFNDFSVSAPQVAHRLDSKTGNTIWSNTLGSSYIRGIDNIGDVNNDSLDELVIATQLPPRLVVLNGVNGNILFDHPFGTTLNQRGDRAAVLNDIDSNGVNEFLGGNREGKVICFYGGNGIITLIHNSVVQPSDFILYQNYPNPFNPLTKINYELRTTNYVSLEVFDAVGKEVAILVNEKQNAGTYETEFDGSNLASGIYFYRLQVDGFIIDTKRMVFFK